MRDYQKIYRESPDAYDALVRAEDADGCLAEALADLLPIEPVLAVEVGAGTGRLTRILLDIGIARVHATEIEPAMLKLAQSQLAGFGERVRYDIADARSLPLTSGTADVSAAGWVYGHFRSWFPDSWRSEIGSAISELDRVTRTGGLQVIVETLGTGHEQPSSSPALAEYYSWLEEELGFTREVIRTDYLFPSVLEAALATSMFFGDEFGARVTRHRWCRVPECTGVWTRSKTG